MRTNSDFAETVQRLSGNKLKRSKYSQTQKKESAKYLLIQLKWNSEIRSAECGDVKYLLLITRTVGELQMIKGKYEVQEQLIYVEGMRSPSCWRVLTTILRLFAASF